MSDELKACPNPWCKDDDEWLQVIIEPPWAGSAVHVWCSFCSNRGPHKATKAEAIAAWNHRPLEDKQQAVIDGLVDALKSILNEIDIEEWDDACGKIFDKARAALAKAREVKP